MHNEVTYAFEKYVCVGLCFYRFQKQMFRIRKIYSGVSKLEFSRPKKSFNDSMYC